MFCQYDTILLISGGIHNREIHPVYERVYTEEEKENLIIL